MPASLPRDRFESARRFVAAEARQLDRTLLDFALGEGGAEPALVALSEFQNPDGGFGHGLEPDTQGPASTAIATSVALRLLLQLGAPARHPMVAGALGWLAETLDRERGVWWSAGPGEGHAPHAPWWKWSEDAIGTDGLAGAEQGFRFNPTAELLGQLYAYGEAAPAHLIAAVEAEFRRTLAATNTIEGAYDLKCAARLAETQTAPADLRAETESLVRRSFAVHDPHDEHLSPLELAPTPLALFADAVKDRLDPAFERLLSGQQPDGGWALFWDWSFVDKAAWQKARRDWRGWLTRDAVEAVAAWGRVAD